MDVVCRLMQGLSDADQGKSTLDR